MENRITRPPSGNFGVNSFSGSSRKRQSTALNQPVAISESNLQYYTQRESNLQNSNFHSGPHGEDNTSGSCFSQAKSIEPTALGHQFEKDLFPTQTVHPGSWINSNGNLSLHGMRTDNIFNTSHVYPQPLEYKGPFDSLNMQASVGRPWPTQVVPNEVYQSLPYVKSDGANTRRNQAACGFEEIGNPSSVPSKFRQCSGFSNNGGINDFPSVEATSFGSSHRLEQIQNPTFSQNVMQLSSSGTSGVTLESISANEEQVQGEGFAKIKETEKASDMKSLMHPLPDSSPKNSCPSSTVENGQKTDQTHGSPVSDEKRKLQFGKPASTVAERLWEGSVRLTSTVVVCAVAFFKSGEKLLDTNWSESVEVKGKVRLDAFEKYIQDLPRSRNRGLMVISLCWKEGSSEAGLSGMKEVAKGYKKAEKVGRAPVSPGIDLYICPRCDAIITILAKHGFFKGMAAVEDKPDSMIGCVVWRKNQTSSNSVAMKPESKSNRLSEKPLNSPSLSPLPQAAGTEKQLPVVQTAQEGAERSDSESKKLAETNNSVAVPDQPKTTLELQKPVMPFSSGKVKEPMTFVDDDDLPEFDFRTACGISQTNMTKPLVSVLLDKRHPAEGNRNTDRSMLPVPPNLPAVPTSGQRSDLSKFPSTANEGMRSSKLIGDPRPQIPPVLPIMREMSSVRNNVPTTCGSATAFPHPKNIFDDDDDDMPEWCPQERSLAETTSRSTAFPSELQNPSFHNLVRGCPQPVPFSPAQNAIRPPFLSQGFPPDAPQPRSIKKGQNSSMGSVSNSILGPAPSFDTKVPFYPAEKRGRRRH